MIMNYSLILASKSPRRHELIGWLDIPFRTIIAPIKEETDLEDPMDMAIELAKMKQNAVYSIISKENDFLKKSHDLIVSADTIVVLGGDIFGKPKSLEGAREMLMKLSGQTHEVITGVSMRLCLDNQKSRFDHFAIKTAVTFDHISEDTLDTYLRFGESMDKAGAYGIQGAALSFVSQIEGSYSNVVGFPLSDFLTKLKRLIGYENSANGDWRASFV